MGLRMVEEEAEAETEKAALLVGRCLGKGLRMARRRGRVLERRDMRGKALRRRSDMVVVVVGERGRGLEGFKDWVWLKEGEQSTCGLARAMEQEMMDPCTCGDC